MAISVPDHANDVAVAGTTGNINVTATTQIVVGAQVSRDTSNTDRVLTSFAHGANALTGTMEVADAAGLHCHAEMRYLDSAPVQDVPVTWTAGVLTFSAAGALVLDGAATGGPLDVAEDQDTAANPSATVDVVAGGIVVFCSVQGAVDDIAMPTGFTEVTRVVAQSRMVGYKLIGADGTETVTLTAAAEGHSLLVASWAPASAPEVNPAATVVTAHCAVAVVTATATLNPAATIVTAHCAVGNVGTAATVTPTATVVTAHCAVAVVTATATVTPTGTIVTAHTAVASITATATIAPTGTVVTAHCAVADVGSVLDVVVNPVATIVTAHTGVAAVTATTQVAPVATVVTAHTAVAAISATATVTPSATVVVAVTAVAHFALLVLVGPFTTTTVRHPRTTVLEAHARTTSLERHPRTTEAP